MKKNYLIRRRLLNVSLNNLSKKATKCHRRGLRQWPVYGMKRGAYRIACC